MASESETEQRLESLGPSIKLKKNKLSDNILPKYSFVKPKKMISH